MPQETAAPTAPRDDLSAKRLHVIHVLNSGSYGGLESVVRALATGFAARGHRIQVAALIEPEPNPHPYVEELQRCGIEVLPVRLPARSYFRERRELVGLLRRMGPDLVHSHGYRADLQVGPVARRLGIPCLATAHGFLGGGFKNRFYERMQEIELRRFDAVVAVSAPLERRLRSRRVPGERLHLLPNAWEPRHAPLSRTVARRELGLPQDVFVAGYVGRLSPEKGPDLFVRTIAAAGDPRIWGCVVGDGPERSAVERLADEFGIADRIRLVGPRPAAGRLFPAFDAFVLSSRTEGTPIVLFEAMAAAVPVVAARVGGVPDVLGSEEAWLVQPGDSAEMARALGEVRERPEEARRRGACAVHRLQTRYRVEPWLDAYERLYRAAIEAAP